MGCFRQRGHDTLHAGPQADDLPGALPEGDQGAVGSDLWALWLRQVVSPAVRQRETGCLGIVFLSWLFGYVHTGKSPFAWC